MVINSSSALVALFAGSLLVSPLKAVLLTPEDMGSEYHRRSSGSTALLNPVFAREKACHKAAERVSVVYRSKIKTAVKHEKRWEGFSEYLVTGTAARITALERAAKALVRDCRAVTVETKGSKDIIRSLPTGRLGDSAYGHRFRSGFPGGDLEHDSALATDMMLAIDVVIVRVKNTLIVLEHDGNVGEFDPGLTIPTARTAVSRLQKARAAA